MATAFIMVGSVLGLFVRIGGYILLDLSVAAALAIWIGSGPLSALLALALSAVRRPARPAPHDSTLGEAA